MPEQRIGSYRILKECGSGSYGQVFLVQDALGRKLALKKLFPRTEGMERELQGLINFRSCRHAHLLAVHHVDQCDGFWYYTMDAADNLNDSDEDYLPDTLANRLTRHGKIKPEQLAVIVEEITAGLKALHADNLLHRDIKPANILFINGKAVLADIGLVTSDHAASLVGTPGYLPPDLLADGRPMTAADDFHALGKVVYCALTGLPPEKFPSTPETISSAVGKQLLDLSIRYCVPVKEAIPARKRKHFTEIAVLLLIAIGTGIFLLRPAPQIPIQTVAKAPAATIPARPELYALKIPKSVEDIFLKYPLKGEWAEVLQKAIAQGELADKQFAVREEMLDGTKVQRKLDQDAERTISFSRDPLLQVYESWKDLGRALRRLTQTIERKPEFRIEDSEFPQKIEDNLLELHGRIVTYLNKDLAQTERVLAPDIKRLLEQYKLSKEEEQIAEKAQNDYRKWARERQQSSVQVTTVEAFQARQAEMAKRWEDAEHRLGEAQSAIDTVRLHEMLNVDHCRDVARLKKWLPQRREFLDILKKRDLSRQK